MALLDLLKPGVPRRALFFIAAAAWLGAGSMLLYRGGRSLHGDMLLLACGIIAGLLFFRLLFRRIAARHIARIGAISRNRPCLFSFLDWRGYGLMAVMIAGGILLRTSEVLPGPLLAAFSIGMGTPLVLSSLRFAAAGWYSDRPTT